MLSSAAGFATANNVRAKRVTLMVRLMRYAIMYDISLIMDGHALVNVGFTSVQYMHLCVKPCSMRRRDRYLGGATLACAQYALFVDVDKAHAV